MRIKALSIIVGLTVSTLAFAATTPKDEFFWLSQINKASLVLNSQEGLLKPDVSKKIAAGIQQVINAGDKEGGARPSRVIKYEPLLQTRLGKGESKTIERAGAK